MARQILITGGAGFIGSHVANELLSNGYDVRVLDNLCTQVHGDRREKPSYLNDSVDLVVGDVRDYDTVKKALKGVDAVYHLASAVGVGQSMYQITHYTDTNNMGTATLLQALIDSPIERLVVASSMSIYGEGMYRTRTAEIVEGIERPLSQLREGKWELSADDGSILEPIPTPESKTPSLSSVYALSKYDQERLCLMIGRAYSIPTVALRFFNVYGPGQALSNPYTGALAIFASRLLNNRAPLIFEDGGQRRDFVSVYDVARACCLALDEPSASGQAFNIGSGHSFTIQEIASRVAVAVGKRDLSPDISGQYRAGDIRHCFADISLAKSVLKYEPMVSLERGLSELAQWLEGQQANDHVAEARAELTARGLTV